MSVHAWPCGVCVVALSSRDQVETHMFEKHGVKTEYFLEMSKRGKTWRGSARNVRKS